MTPASPLIDALLWRHAVKGFDPSKKVSDADLDELLEAIRLAPSSYGLQPWKFIVVTDPAIKEQIRKSAWDQRQVTECSHLIVLCAMNTMSEDYVKEYVTAIAAERGAPREAFKDYEAMMLGSIKRGTADSLAGWMQKQTYIALGTLLTAAALKKIDACPMEGFDNAAVNKILGLEDKNLHAVTLCPLGYRGEGDVLAGAKKVRWPADRVIERR